MKRGDIYRVYRGSKTDPKEHRVFVVVSRQELIDNAFTTVVCAPVYSNYREEITTQVEVGIEEGLKHDSAVFCDDLTSVFKNRLTDYIGSLAVPKMEELNTALRIALAVE